MVKTADTVAMVTTEMLSIFMAIVATLSLFYVNRTSSFKWVKMMFCFCIVQDIGIVLFSLAGYLEEDDVHGISWLVGLSTFFFFYMENLIYWIICFKYWTISIEVPRAFHKERRSRLTISQRSYNIVLWAGIVVNFVMCFAVSYVRFLLSKEFINNPNNPSNVPRDLLTLNEDL